MRRRSRPRPQARARRNSCSVAFPTLLAISVRRAVSVVTRGRPRRRSTHGEALYDLVQKLGVAGQRDWGLLVRQGRHLGGVSARRVEGVQASHRRHHSRFQSQGMLRGIATAQHNNRQCTVTLKSRLIQRDTPSEKTSLGRGALPVPCPRSRAAEHGGGVLGTAGSTCVDIGVGLIACRHMKRRIAPLEQIARMVGRMTNALRAARRPDSRGTATQIAILIASVLNRGRLRSIRFVRSAYLEGNGASATL